MLKCTSMSLLHARMRKAGLSNWFCLSVCQSSKFWADHDNEGSNTSGHHSNNDDGDNLVHGVPEGG